MVSIVFCHPAHGPKCLLVYFLFYFHIHLSHSLYNSLLFSQLLILYLHFTFLAPNCACVDSTLILWHWPVCGFWLDILAVTIWFTKSHRWKPSPPCDLRWRSEEKMLFTVWPSPWWWWQLCLKCTFSLSPANVTMVTNFTILFDFEWQTELWLPVGWEADRLRVHFEISMIQNDKDVNFWNHPFC